MNWLARLPLLQKLGISRKMLSRTAINYIGISIARVLGLAYSFVLAHAYSSSDYGYAAYIISLGGLFAVVTQPFGQHIISLIAGKYRQQPEELHKMLGSAWFIWWALLLLTLLIGVPLFAGLNRLSGELIAVFLGVTFFYTYQGMATGFLSSWRVLAMYLSSNVLQILIVLIYVYVLRLPSVIPSVYVYGIVYFIPLTVLVLAFPLPLSFRIRWDPARIRHIFKLAGPVFLSHILYILYFAMDIQLLELFANRSTIGVYSLTKTLSTAFYLVPQSISMLLLPIIAGSGKAEGRRQFWASLWLSLIVNGILLLLYLLVYPAFILGVYGDEYYIGLLFALLMALSAIMFATRSVVFAALVASNRTNLDSISRAIMMLVIFIFGVALIPTQGAMGAAWAVFASNLSGNIPYVWGWWRLRRKGATAAANTPPPPTTLPEL